MREVSESSIRGSLFDISHCSSYRKCHSPDVMTSPTLRGESRSNPARLPATSTPCSDGSISTPRDPRGMESVIDSMVGMGLLSLLADATFPCGKRPERFVDRQSPMGAERQTSKEQSRRGDHPPVPPRRSIPRDSRRLKLVLTIPFTLLGEAVLDLIDTALDTWLSPSSREDASATRFPSPRRLSAVSVLSTVSEGVVACVVSTKPEDNLSSPQPSYSAYLLLCRPGAISAAPRRR